MSKLANEIPFGGTLSSKMKIGSLVSWSEWLISDDDLVEEVFYGTIVEKITNHSSILEINASQELDDEPLRIYLYKIIAKILKSNF